MLRGLNTTKEMTNKSRGDEQAIEGLAFAELVIIIEEALIDENMDPVFKLADLAHQGWRD